MSGKKSEKRVLWVGSTLKDIQGLPEKVRIDFGHGLFQAQKGDFPTIGKVLSGFGGASVVELKLESSGDAYRAVYTVQFKDALVVLHVFKKKSKKGKQTPKEDINLIRSRLKLAKGIYDEWKKESTK